MNAHNLAQPHIQSTNNIHLQMLIVTMYDDIYAYIYFLIKQYLNNVKLML